MLPGATGCTLSFNIIFLSINCYLLVNCPCNDEEVIVENPAHTVRSSAYPSV